MKRNWFRIFSPCVLLFVFMLVYIIWLVAEQKQTQGWSFLAAMALAPFALALLVLDFAVKKLIPKNTGYLWLVQLIGIILFFAIWIAIVRGNFFTSSLQ